MITAFTKCRLIDGNGLQPVEDVSLVIDEDRILEVSHARDFASTVKVIELDGMTLMPGMIDCHIHFAPWGLNAAVDPERTVAYLAARTVASLRASLESGFTSVRDAGGLDPGFRDAIVDGVVAGPRVQTSITVLSPTNGVGDRTSVQGVAADIPFGMPAPICDGPDAARAKVREVLRAGADFVKIATTGGASTKRIQPTQQLFTQQEISAIVDEAHSFGAAVICHAVGGPGVMAAVEAGVDTIEHGGYLDDAVVAEMSSRGTWYVPTFAAYRKHELYGPDYKKHRAIEMKEAHQSSFNRARAGGVRIAMGSDAGTYDTDSGSELDCLVDAGLSPLEALTMATGSSAQCLGVDDDLGTLERGKIADLMAIEGNPVTDISLAREPSAIAFVMKNGKFVERAQPYHRDHPRRVWFGEQAEGRD